MIFLTLNTTTSTKMLSYATPWSHDFSSVVCVVSLKLTGLITKVYVCTKPPGGRREKTI